MSERNLYRGLNNFEGSIDEDGKLYDENHRLVGRIDGNDVYDCCNIKQGTIDTNGKLWDCNHTYVGEAHGNNFIGPTYQSTGMVRGDSFGEGDGCEYGALMMLKKRNEQYSGGAPDNDYNFPNNDDEDEDDEEEDEEDETMDACADCGDRGEEDAEDDDSLDDAALPQAMVARKSDRWNGDTRPFAKKQGFVRPKATTKRSSNQSHVPPDSVFSSGRKNEYRLNGITYVDVSGMNSFWSTLWSIWAELNGKAVITGWDRMSGAWDCLKREAARNR